MVLRLAGGKQKRHEQETDGRLTSSLRALRLCGRVLLNRWNLRNLRIGNHPPANADGTDL
jgi:hypothetical protein